MISTADRICPLRSRSILPCRESPSQEVLRFEVNGFPGWRVEWVRQPKHLEKSAELEDATFWLKPQLLAYLARDPQGVTQSLVCLHHSQWGRIWLSVQAFNFQAGQQIRQAELVEKQGRFRRWLSGLFSFKVLVIGQFMVSGLYGQQCFEEPTEQGDRVSAALLHAVAKQLTQQQPDKYWAILMKDLVRADHPHALAWEGMGYYPLPVDPSMQLALPSLWRDFTDYLLDLSSKYRVRYRRARKQLEPIVKRDLSGEEVEALQPQMHALYQAVKQEAEFDAISLSEEYFTSLKAIFPKECRLVGYFLADQLVGFTSSIANGDTLHAHYLGFEPTINKQHHLYHNMLFDLVEQGIAQNYKKLDLGRTALTIKSSVGAQPQQYCCSLYGLSVFTRLAIRYCTPVLFKPTTWEERSPFKEVAGL